MIKRKKKMCRGCGQERYIFSKGLCGTCYNIKHPRIIKQKSSKRVKEDKEYAILRDAYLDEHPFCEIGLEGCTRKATEIHHTKGRGKNYLNVKTFKAICNHCHRMITDDSKSAIESGYSQSRLKI